MTRDAYRVGAGQVVVIVNVALCARDGGVCAGQREPDEAMIELGVEPVVRAMALLACSREPAGRVVRICRLLIIPGVAGVALD